MLKRFFSAPSGADPLVRGGALDALRFLAAALIVLYHYAGQAPVPFTELHPALTRAHLATDFFLMLSGYVLARAYGPKLDAGKLQATRFLLRRVTRVWPAHLLVLAATAALLVAAATVGLGVNNAESFAWSTLLPNALLVQAWGLGVPEGWNWPTWSLSALIVCYALFPVVWSAMSRTTALRGLLLALALVAAADLLARAVGQNFYDLPPSIGVLRAIPLFVLGTALARYGAPGGLTLAAARATGVAALVGVVVLQAFGQHDAISVLAIATVMLMAGARTPPRPAPLAAKAAELSFALYITHSLAGIVWFRSLGLVFDDGLSGPLGWAAWAGGFAFAVLCAFVFHRLIDMPLQAWINQRLDARRRSPAVAVGAV